MRVALLGCFRTTVDKFKVCGLKLAEFLLFNMCDLGVLGIEVLQLDRAGVALVASRPGNRPQEAPGLCRPSALEVGEVSNAHAPRWLDVDFLLVGRDHRTNAWPGAGPSTETNTINRAGRPGELANAKAERSYGNRADL